MVRVPTQETAAPTKTITLLFPEEINMLEGLEDKELEAYLDENLRIVPLFEIDVLETANEYIPTSASNEDDYEPDPELVLELRKAREAFEREMEISRRVTTSTLEEINVGSAEAPRLLTIAKVLTPSKKMAMTDLLREFKDVFAWSHDDMKGLDPKFY